MPAAPGSPDNEEGSLLVYLHTIFDYQDNVYIVQDIIGSGSFSEVYKVLNAQTGMVYAFKVSKSQNEIQFQANREIQVLTQLKQFCDETVLTYIVEMIGWFTQQRHVITIFKLYPASLYDLLAGRDFRGFPLILVQHIAQNIITAIHAIHQQNIIHTDIKPDNIVIDENENFRLIDFGGSIMPSDAPLMYLQSRFYRAPEVILELQNTTAIDIWSFGVVLAEAFLGPPIFAGRDHLNVLQLMELRLGDFPRELLSEVVGRPADYFSKGKVVNPNPREPIYDPVYSTQMPLHRMIQVVTYLEPTASQEEKNRETKQKEVFSDLILGMLRFNPSERFTAEQVMNHPFMTMDL